MEKKLIVIVGPTGIGKTDLSIYLAQQLNCDIISADSRQFYRQMSIGTAKPSKEELNKVKHHLIDCMDIDQEYSAGKFESDALIILNELFFEQLKVRTPDYFLEAVKGSVSETIGDIIAKADKIIKSYLDF